MVECPACKKRLAADSKVCRSQSGKGCGAKVGQGTKIYWVTYRDPTGRKKHKRIGPSRKAAENFERKAKVEITEGRYIDRVNFPKVCIENFVKNSYRPWCEVNNQGYDSKKYFLDRIVSEWGSKFLSEMDDRAIDTFKIKMIGEGKIATFNRTFAALSHMYSKAIEYKQIGEKPFQTEKVRIKEPPRVRFLMPDEIQALLSECSGYLRPIVLTPLLTGMRKEEVLSMRVGIELNLDRRVISLAKTKNDEPRHLPINDTLHVVIKATLNGHKRGDFLFRKSDGERYKDVKKGFTAACTRAGIENFTFHDTRHTFASHLVMAGISLYTVKELLGHKDIRQTQKYAHLAPEHNLGAVKVLDGLINTYADTALKA